MVAGTNQPPNTPRVDSSIRYLRKGLNEPARAGADQVGSSSKSKLVARRQKTKGGYMVARDRIEPARAGADQVGSSSKSKLVARRQKTKGGYVVARDRIELPTRGFSDSLFYQAKSLIILK